MTIKPEFKKRDIRSFIIRSGRITPAQSKGIKKYWSDYGLSLKDGFINLEKIFPYTKPLVLEIGYGMGNSLLHMAIHEADKNFIGIEVHPPGVGHLVNEAGKLQLDNLRTFCADAIDVLNDCVADNSVTRIQIYFPDPWHKKRHHKRRIIQPAFVELVSRKLEPGGLLHLATDWQNYAEYMLETLQKSTQLQNSAIDDRYCPRPAWRPITKFEQRGQRLGHGTWDLLFQKKMR